MNEHLTEEELDLLRQEERKALEIHENMPGSVHACPPWIARRLAEARRAKQGCCEEVSLLGVNCLKCGDPVVYDFYCEPHLPPKIRAIWDEVRAEGTCKLLCPNPIDPKANGYCHHHRYLRHE